MARQNRREGVFDCGISGGETSMDSSGVIVEIHSDNRESISYLRRQVRGLGTFHDNGCKLLGILLNQMVILAKIGVLMPL